MNKPKNIILIVGVVIAAITIIAASAYITIKPIALGADLIPGIELFNINTILNLIFNR